MNRPALTFWFEIVLKSELMYTLYQILVYVCRRRKDFPELMDSQMEEIQQREHLEKIQTYRLVRDNVLEHRKQQELNRKELMRHQLEMYEHMQVSQDREGAVWCLKVKIMISFDYQSKREWGRSVSFPSG